MTGSGHPPTAPRPGPRHPAFESLAEYGFVRLAREKAERLARGEIVYDFTMGDPREETPPFIREALRRAVPAVSSYPAAVGLPELRQSVAAWMDRRFGVALDPDRHILPNNGSKEAIYLVHQAVLDPRRSRTVVLVPDPAYPVYEIGAIFAGAEVVRLPLSAERGFLPDFEAVEPAIFERTALLWLNYPNNPTTATASLEFFREAAALARRHGFWLASDEAYSEIYFADPPPSALQAGLDNVVVFQTLSKRSAMTGYRSGFVAGDPALLDHLRQVRPSQGVATPEFIQRAAIAAWSDESHVARQRDIYATKRAILEPALRARQIELFPSLATFYLYARVPEGWTTDAFAKRLFDHGVAVSPGTLFGPRGDGWVRFALVPSIEHCEAAAQVLSGIPFE